MEEKPSREYLSPPISGSLWDLHDQGVQSELIIERMDRRLKKVGAAEGGSQSVRRASRPARAAEAASVD
jgi:hypothetical protein